MIIPPSTHSRSLAPGQVCEDFDVRLSDLIYLRGGVFGGSLTRSQFRVERVALGNHAFRDRLQFKNVKLGKQESRKKTGFTKSWL